MHLFTKVDGEWRVTGELAPQTNDQNLHFGQDLAYANGILAVSASGDDTLADGAGAVLLFENAGAGQWNEIAKLTASDGREHDFFGASIGCRS